jgi:8-oxo-dGTP pyrophosphatase MutT (NUDIX family)
VARFFAVSSQVLYLGDMEMIRLPDPEALIRLLRTGARTELTVDGYARAAVLVALRWTGHDYDVLLTKRTDQVETHKGQVAFPGGMKDGSDSTVVDTALREAEEELGIPASAVQIAGVLDDIAIPTGFVVSPVVGLLATLPPLHPNPDEVVDAFYVPLSFFAGDVNGRREQRTVGGRQYDVWYYTAGGHQVWGATAAIIRRFLAKIGPTDRPKQRPPE